MLVQGERTAPHGLREIHVEDGRAYYVIYKTRFEEKFTTRFFEVLCLAGLVVGCMHVMCILRVVMKVANMYVPRNKRALAWHYFLTCMPN